jgi:hypothetical protein
MMMIMAMAMAMRTGIGPILRFEYGGINNLRKE